MTIDYNQILEHWLTTLLGIILSSLGTIAIMLWKNIRNLLTYRRSAKVAEDALFALEKEVRKLFEPSLSLTASRPDFYSKYWQAHDVLQIADDLKKNVNETDSSDLTVCWRRLTQICLALKDVIYKMTNRLTDNQSEKNQPVPLGWFQAFDEQKKKFQNLEKDLLKIRPNYKND